MSALFTTFLCNMVLLLTADAGTAFDLTGLMETSVNSIQTQLFTVLNIIVPVIVGVMAAVVCIKFGFQWMKKLGKA